MDATVIRVQVKGECQARPRSLGEHQIELRLKGLRVLADSKTILLGDVSGLSDIPARVQAGDAVEVVGHLSAPGEIVALNIRFLLVGQVRDRDLCGCGGRSS